MRRWDAPPTDAAVRATLRILVEKGHLRYEQDGPRYVYLPTVPRAAAGRSALAHLVSTFFGGSAEGALVSLLELERNKLSDEQRAQLKRLIDHAASEGKMKCSI